MYRRFYLEVLGRPPLQPARSLEDALELAARAPGTWRVLMRVGRGDAVVVRSGVN